MLGSRPRSPRIPERSLTTYRFQMRTFVALGWGQYRSQRVAGRGRRRGPGSRGAEAGVASSRATCAGAQAAHCPSTRRTCAGTDAGCAARRTCTTSAPSLVCNVYNIHNIIFITTERSNVPHATIHSLRLAISATNIPAIAAIAVAASKTSSSLGILPYGDYQYLYEG